MATHNLNLEGLGHGRSQKQRRRMVLVAYMSFVGMLIIVAVSVFSGHLFFVDPTRTRGTPHFFFYTVLSGTLTITWPILMLISIFNNISLSRALPEYTMKQSTLDERQLRVRDSAYRYSYAIVSLAILGIFIFKFFTLFPGVHFVQPSINRFEFSLFLMSIGGLMNLVPLSIIAWNERD